MTEHYVTLFDSLFLPQGLALHASLERHAGDFHLWVIAMDDTCVSTLTSLALPNLTVIPLGDVETPELRAVKAERSVAEYCWTLTPFTPDAVFDRDPEVHRVTYIDADMWLLCDPAPIFAEMDASRATALITPHAYSPKYESNIRYGIYCVQFMPFERDKSADIRRTWQNQCIEWCSAVPEATRFGDQKYLDSWPATYGTRVRVLSHPEWTQAPWNVTRFAAEDAITFHFHRLRLLDPNRVSLGLYAIPRSHIDKIYRPYLDNLRSALNRLDELGLPFREQADHAAGLEGLQEWWGFRSHNARYPTARRTLAF